MLRFFMFLVSVFVRYVNKKSFDENNIRKMYILHGVL